VGGAQAVALLAYGGTDTNGAELTPVHMITGPGNIYVTAAKRLCRSRVGIDAEAGPTEIAILADHTADPAHVAADLISQAEHDEMASSVLVTPSEVLAAATDTALAAQLQTTVHRERVEAALRGRQSAIILVDDLDAAVLVVNAYAAEHLEIQTVDAPRVATTAPDPITCCRPRAAPGIPAACRCRRSCAASMSSTTPRRRSKTFRDT
jgi:histidinol dehydrogenase